MYSPLLTCFSGELLTFKDGESASSALKAGGQLEAQYKVVKGDSSVDAGVQRQFSNSNQYGIFDFHRTFFDVSFAGDAGYQKNAAEDRLYSAVHRLPKFNAGDKSVVRVYRDLFSSIGTHVIVGMTYGARLTFVSLLPLRFQLPYLRITKSPDILRDKFKL